MIQNFIVIRNNGSKAAPLTYVDSVPILEQINNPAFHPKAYEWESDGRIYTLPVDGTDTLTADLLPDGSGIIVLQNAHIHGSDNVVILDPGNEVHKRIINPHKTSRYFMGGDRFWFDAVKMHGDQAILNIQVQRERPGKSHDALPIYEASYDPATWQLLNLEWKPWT